MNNKVAKEFVGLSKVAMATGLTPDSGPVECSICLSSMVNRSPRALPCLHTFCEACLKQLAKNGNSVVCPNCRKTSQLPKGGVSSLPVNFYLQPAVPKRQTEPMCQTCEVTGSPKIANILCSSCQRFMCDACSFRHSTIPAFVDHQIQKLRKTEGRGLNVMCPTHNHNITMFCKECSVFVCDYCVMTVDHEGHEGALTDSMKYLMSIKQLVSQRVSCLDERLAEKLDFTCTELHKVNIIEEQIKQEGEKRVAKINEQVRSLVSELRRGHKSALLGQVDEITKAQSDIRNLSSVTSEDFVPENFSQLNTLKNAEARLKQVEQDLDVVHLNPEATIAFSPSHERPLVGSLITGSLPSSEPIGDRRSEGIEVMTNTGAFGLSSMTDTEKEKCRPHLCTECHEELIEPWFKCGMCTDYELCSTCERKRPSHKKRHVFIKLYQESKLPNKVPLIESKVFGPKDPFLTGMKCSSCNVLTRSDPFYKCCNCPDFIICAKCEELQHKGKERHDAGHVFVKMTWDQLTKLKNVWTVLL